MSVSISSLTTLLPVITVVVVSVLVGFMLGRGDEIAARRRRLHR